MRLKKEKLVSPNKLASRHFKCNECGSLVAQLFFTEISDRERLTVSLVTKVNKADWDIGSGIQALRRGPFPRAPFKTLGLVL